MSAVTERIHEWQKAARAAQSCRVVCRHYGLTEKATQAAVYSCTVAPDAALACYRAIVNSLTPHPNPLKGDL